MSSIHGKNTLSFRRTKTNVEDSSSAIILQDYEFAHEAQLGETYIDIDALVEPTSINTGISNPSGTELQAINLSNNSSSLVIISSEKGTLQKGSWSISNSGRRINLAFATQANEIFTVQLRSTQATTNVVDADSFVVTGTLIAGQTDIPLGQVFNLNTNPTQQIGEVILTIDGVEQLRNVGNATASPLADGNYEEVNVGNNQTSLLRLNESFPVDVAYSVKVNGLVVNAKPNNSFTQKLESLGGQLDALIPTVATLAGVPEGDFQAAPNNIDLKAFSDKVYQNKADIADHEVRITDLEEYRDDSPLIDYFETSTGVVINAGNPNPTLHSVNFTLTETTKVKFDMHMVFGHSGGSNYGYPQVFLNGTKIYGASRIHVGNSAGYSYSHPDSPTVYRELPAGNYTFEYKFVWETGTVWFCPGPATSGSWVEPQVSTILIEKMK